MKVEFSQPNSANDGVLRGSPMWQSVTCVTQTSSSKVQTGKQRLAPPSFIRSKHDRHSPVIPFSIRSFATCRGCERLVCRGDSCSQWVDSIGIWECTGCQSNRVIQQKAGEWLLNQLTARLKQPGPVELSEGNLLGLGLGKLWAARLGVGALTERVANRQPTLPKTESDDARSTASSTVSVNQRIKVREFIEELLSSMLHGPLDDVTVGQLMKHESYIRLFRKYHTRLSRCLYNLELSIHHSLMSGKNPCLSGDKNQPRKSNSPEVATPLSKSLLSPSSTNNSPWPKVRSIATGGNCEAGSRRAVDAAESNFPSGTLTFA
uniref:Uncharacterized protein n=1 Tax=Anopheles dirus TaxID=7168 RepID=A0A182NJF4_9DIPT